MMDLGKSALLERLRGARSVLIAGAGGGFDVYAGVPLYLYLRAAGVEAHLANLTFSMLSRSHDARVRPGMFRIDARTRGPAVYFPEGWLCRWLAARGEPDACVWTFERTGVQTLAANYAHLADTLRLDALVLLDGGTDILMRGDEEGLGTPLEDMSSLAAASTLDLATMAVLCVGFGIDAFHGVCHSHFLENTAALASRGAFLGAHTWTPDMPEVAAYMDLVRTVTAEHPGATSIVNGSVVAALEGRFGDWQFTPRTASSELYINPLMTLAWAYELKAVAARSLSVPLLLGTDSIDATVAVMAQTYARMPRRRATTIPV